MLNLFYLLYIKELSAKYQGSIFGFLWAIFNPLILIIVYTYVFAIVFKFRWDGVTDTKVMFGLVLYLGVLQYNFLAEVLGKAPSLIIGNSNYVKKVIFPTEVLSLVDVAVAFTHMTIAFTIWLLAYAFFINIPSIYTLLLPILVLPLVLFGVGLSLTISALTVYIRDLNQLVGFFIMALLFCTPIFYPKSAVPQNFQWLVEINPLSNSIELTRQVLLFNNYPSLSTYIFALVSSTVVCGIGYVVFKKCKKGFPDAI